jgi:hypothetical protein
MDNETNLEESTNNEPITTTDDFDQTYEALLNRLTQVENMLSTMSDTLNNVSESQKNFVNMGGVIRETEPNDINDDFDDDFIPLEDMDWNI